MAIAFPPNSPMEAAEFFGAKDGEKDKQLSPPEFVKTPNRSISYNADGRKLHDGIPEEEHEPDELWKKIFTRQFYSDIYTRLKGTF
uniref:Uncharacterized protein n=1 Tax=Plectus sambesii TaxID=2011161 RepID=A0A914VBY1_9BILA